MAGSANEQQAESLFPWEAEGGEKRGEGGGEGRRMGGREIERGQSESVLKMGEEIRRWGRVGGWGGGAGDGGKKTNKENK